MPEVTVTGVGGSAVTVPIGSKYNAVLAQRLLSDVSASIADKTVTPYQYSGKGHLKVPTGESSLDFTGHGAITVPVDTTSVIIPQTGKSGWGHDKCETDQKNDTVFGGQGKEQLVVSGLRGITYFANAGIGTVVAGGGNNILSADPKSGAHLFVTDSANDTIRALGAGNDTVSAGLGYNKIVLGAGTDSVKVTGHDTIYLGSGDAKVDVEKGGTVTIFAGHGNDTVDLALASRGNTSLKGCDWDKGHGKDRDSSTDTFVFKAGFAGGHTEIKDFTLGQDKLVLQGYGKHEVQYALKHATVSCGSVTLTLSDKTTITFDGIDHITKSSFS